MIVGAGIVASLAVVLPAFAQTQPGGPNGFGPGGRFGTGMHKGTGMQPGIVGTVTGIDANGNSNEFTVTARTRPNATTTPATAYTVDATNATIFKNGATSTVASIATGDMVMVQGTVSGTLVTAKVVRDGIMTGSRGMPRNGSSTFGWKPTSTRPTSGTLPFEGNGEPVIAGSVTTISGETLTVTNASNVIYTVDVSNSTFVKNGATTTITSILAGDSVIIQGTVNGTSVTASSVIDQGSGGHGNGPSTRAPPQGLVSGFLGAIGNFFKHIFGF